MIYYCGEFSCQNIIDKKCNNQAFPIQYKKECISQNCPFVFCGCCKNRITCRTECNKIFKEITRECFG